MVNQGEVNDSIDQAYRMLSIAIRIGQDGEDGTTIRALDEDLEFVLSAIKDDLKGFGLRPQENLEEVKESDCPEQLKPLLILGKKIMNVIRAELNKEKRMDALNELVEKMLEIDGESRKDRSRIRYHDPAKKCRGFMGAEEALRRLQATREQKKRRLPNS